MNSYFFTDKLNCLLSVFKLGLNSQLDTWGEY